MLSCTDLSLSIQGKSIVHNVSCSFSLGKNYCLLGKNGSWKSSLAMAIAWHPSYEITSGSISLTMPDGDTIDIHELDPHERAKYGIFLAFQAIPEIKWVKLFEFLRSIYNAHYETNLSFVHFKKVILPLMDELHISHDFLRRDVNVWFSGWERRKIEILQLRLLNPKYIILDEVDSWLDVDAFRDVATLMQTLNGSDNTFIIITHYFTILDYIPVDTVYVMDQGRIIQTGWLDIAHSIQKEWFGE